MVLVAALGWRTHKKNRRSHKVVPAGPVYAFVRDVAYVGRSVRHSQLRKIHVHTMFVKGKPAAMIDVGIVKRTSSLREELLAEYASDTAVWKDVPTFRFASNTKLSKRPVRAAAVAAKSKPATGKSEETTATPRTSVRIQKVEERKSVENKKLAIKAAREQRREQAKQARLDAQKRERELKAKIRKIVVETMTSFKQSINKKLTLVKGSLGKKQATLDEKLDSLTDDVKQTLEDELGSRVQVLADKVDVLTSELDASNELRVKCQKRTRKMLDTLNIKVSDTNKKLKKTNLRIKKNSKQVKAKLLKAPKKENVAAPSPPPTAMTPPAVVPAIVSRPATPMVNVVSDPGFAMYTSPPTVPSRVQHFASTGQQYVSPAFASRNFAR